MSNITITPTHARVLGQLTSRWVKGTGFAHRSVGTDLIEAGLVDSRVHKGERQIRINARGEAIRTPNKGEAK